MLIDFVVPPDFIEETGELTSSEARHKWLQEKAMIGRTKGVVWGRASHNPETGAVLYEGWFVRPTNVGPPAFKGSAPVGVSKEADDTLTQYKRVCGILLDALTNYADPEFYHAIAFMGDPPAGDFLEDFSLVPDSSYDRPMPGKLAREAVEKVLKFENLTIISTDS